MLSGVFKNYFLIFFFRKCSSTAEVFILTAQETLPRFIFEKIIPKGFIQGFSVGDISREKKGLGAEEMDLTCLINRISCLLEDTMQPLLLVVWRSHTLLIMKKNSIYSNSLWE